MTSLPSPDISREGAVLRSNRFDDIYYQETDGLAETTHVFLEGNDLPSRFAAHQGPRPFVIGELGFGTGLNILAAARLFEETAPADARLSIWTAEGFPFLPEQLAEILIAVGARWPELQRWAEWLAAAYPHPRPGQRQVDLSNRVRLTFGFGPAEDTLSQALFKADAWFLDGFSPAQNPEMWSVELMRHVAEHTRPGGSFATFTVAGVVRRALSSAGFEVEKRRGFGRKRDMLAGRVPDHNDDKPIVRKLSIVGAGIAGACTAHMAQSAGLEVEMIEANAPASGASGNPAGLLMPRIEAQNNPAAHFYRDAFLFARRFYEEITPDALIPCGGTLFDKATRLQGVLSTALWAKEELLVSDGKLHAGKAAVLHPVEIVDTLTREIKLRKSRVHSLRDDGMNLHLTTDDQNLQSDALIVTAGPASANLLKLNKDMSASRGQVDVFSGPLPDQILTDGSYIAPSREQLICGATYDPAHAEDDVQPDQDSSIANRQAAEELLGKPAGEWLSSRASLRATTRDRHPIAGAMQADSRLFALTGLGSRGLVTAPILARHLIAVLTEDVSPLTLAETQLVAPGRFDERRKRRGQA